MDKQPPQPKQGVPVWIFLLSLFLAIILTAVISGGGVFLWQQLSLQSTQAELEKAQQQLDRPQKLVTPQQANQQQLPKSPSPTPIPTTVTADFTKAINDKDFSTIRTLLSDRIDYTKFATSCCGLITPDDTMQYLQFINSPVTYNFSPVQDAIVNIKTVLPKYSDYTIGIGSDKSVIGFRTSSHSNKVDAILQAVTYEAFEITTPTSPTP